MENLIVKEFNGSQIYTFMWNDKPCWIAKQIVELFGYADATVTINQCVEAEAFENGLEFEVLIKEDLKRFKNIVNEVTKNTLVSSNIINKHTPNLTIFYEDGLYGFLQYTDKPIGVQFRKWLRREVLPSIRQTGAYITNNANPEKLREKASEIEKLQLAYNSTSMLKELLDDAGFDNKSKLLTAKTLYKKAGIDLPIEINEEEHYFDTKQIASKLKIYSKSNKPAQMAVCEIIKKIDLEENEVKGVWETNGSWTGTVNKYTKSVIDKVRTWIEENNRPVKIAGEKKNYHVVYKIE
ncbi:TPA: Bro-N domain-containing protein [Clostridioides difficile]|uniref:BRO N-terminal domain protein n=1 Tax=Clostridium phage CDKM15 TaxID=1868595 RepID=A0A3G1E3F6_9CAUD|nr:Bro-N domain-containing protein [Clostridioides difficile]YP_009830891.1 Bro-N domain-containing protein [Clostridium phage CDKM15]ANT45163.1 BRO N-terminal domain protein [Clostridium phage CDKM15]EJA6787287.1 Bro-N domain-containing protein [Clostridioides difficile]MBH6887013.1 Bro-N domain-containing protein [Clostridioides difficile]MBH7180979.1 Bro-N domain-containing protein [Clostridioides difficile]MBY1592094.1 Bro-N domain-containing protein [Clostridioides difficile]